MGNDQNRSLHKVGNVAFPRQVRDQGSYEWRCRSDRDQVGHRSIVRLPPSGYELYVQMSWMRRWRAFGNDRGGAARLRPTRPRDPDRRFETWMGEHYAAAARAASAPPAPNRGLRTPGALPGRGGAGAGPALAREDPASASPLVYCYPDFLSAEECDALVRVGAARCTISRSPSICGTARCDLPPHRRRRPRRAKRRVTRVDSPSSSSAEDDDDDATRAARAARAARLADATLKAAAAAADDDADSEYSSGEFGEAPATRCDAIDVFIRRPFATPALRETPVPQAIVAAVEERLAAVVGVPPHGYQSGITLGYTRPKWKKNDFDAFLAWRDGDPDAADSVPLNMGAFLRSFFFIPGECCI